MIRCRLFVVEGEPIMQVTFKLVVNDLKRFDAYVRRGPGLQSVNLLRLVVLGIAVIIGIWTTWGHVQQSHGTSGWGFFLSAFIPVAVFGIVLSYFRYLTMKQQKTDPLLTHPQTVYIDRDSVRVATVNSETTYKWSGIFDIGTDDGSLYFLVTKEQGFLVPLRAFATPTDASTFLRTSIGYWKGKAEPETVVVDTKAWPPPPQTLKP